MTDTDNLKALGDYAIDYGSKKTDAIIARVVSTKNSQIRFSQSNIDISKRWEALKLELFVVVGEKTGTTDVPITSEKDVKKVEGCLGLLYLSQDRFLSCQGRFVPGIYLIHLLL